MKHVAIVAPHFTPSNMTSMHRPRFLATYLSEFGWDPTIVTVHEKYYEGRLEPELDRILPEGLRVRKASAWPVRPFRLVGDVGVRGFGGMFREIARLHCERPIDFLVVTIPSSFAAPLGYLANRRFGIPYGIDYQDPWVHEWPGCRVWFSKAWVSYQLSRFLEPIALSRASMVTGISVAYYEDIFVRYPSVKEHVITAAMPNGWSEREYAYLDAHPIPARLFLEAGVYRLVYAGAMLPHSIPVTRAFFEAIAGLRKSGFLPGRFEVHFIGIGEADEASPRSLADEFGVADLVFEHRERMPYLEVLEHLRAASAVLILGSTKPHYAPSKAYQAVLSGHPVLVLLHQSSSGVEFLRDAGTAAMATFDGEKPDITEIQKAFLRLAALDGVKPFAAALERVSARHSAQTLADAMDRALGVLK